MKNLPFTTNKLLITKLLDRKSTRLNSSHDQISYAVFCLKKKIITRHEISYAVERPLVVASHAGPLRNRQSLAGAGSSGLRRVVLPSLAARLVVGERGR